MCTGVEIALAVGSTAAAVSTGVGVANYLAGQEAARASKALADQQRAQLEQENQAAAAQAATQATTGSTFGFGDNGKGAIATGFGFGKAVIASPNSGRGQITGMS